MTMIKFYLRDGDGVSYETEREGANVPRIGELVYDAEVNTENHYQVTKVIWDAETDAAVVVGVRL